MGCFMIVDSMGRLLIKFLVFYTISGYCSIPSTSVIDRKTACAAKAGCGQAVKFVA
jgi:hypothetical protein